MNCKTLLFISSVVAMMSTSHAANYPCSRGKGGVSHCMGQHFVCNDGSVSQSKKICSGAENPQPEKPTKGKKKS